MIKKIILSVPIVISLTYMLLIFINPVWTYSTLHVSDVPFFILMGCNILVVAYLVGNVVKDTQLDESKRYKWIFLLIFFHPFILHYIWMHYKND